MVLNVEGSHLVGRDERRETFQTSLDLVCTSRIDTNLPEDLHKD